MCLRVLAWSLFFKCDVKCLDWQAFSCGLCSTRFLHYFRCVFFLYLFVCEWFVLGVWVLCFRCRLTAISMQWVCPFHVRVRWEAFEMNMPNLEKLEKCFDRLVQVGTHHKHRHFGLLVSRLWFKLRFDIGKKIVSWAAAKAGWYSVKLWSSVIATCWPM